MELEERTLEESLERRCRVCGATLTTAEIQAARETGGPFLCSVHASEIADDDEGADGGAPDPSSAP